MAQINAYLTFNGNCREAMEFYRDCLGGDLSLQTIGESPIADKLPAPMKDCILHSILNNGELTIMGSDCVPEQGLVKGNGVSLNITCSSEAEIKAYYKKLSVDGQPTYPLHNSFWGSLFGGLTDKYGNYWLLNYEKQ